MKSKILFVVLSFSILLTFCTLPNENNDNSLKISKTNNLLSLTNTTNRTVYLFIVEQESAGTINWAPHFEEPKILPTETLTITFNQINNNQQFQTGPGDTIIVYYWDKSDEENPKIYHVVVKI